MLGLCTNLVFGQEYKRGNNWVLGFNPVAVFDFNSGALLIDSLNFPAISTGVSAVSDTNGILVFFSSGFALLARDGFLLEDGLDVNCPKGNILADYYSYRSLFSQTSIILPQKGNRYYVFSTGMSDSAANAYLNHTLTEFDLLNYSIVDMDSNNGKGKVVEKNVILADSQQYINCALQAVKHANGKDWWLVKADCKNHRYQEYLVKEDTILGPYYQYADQHGQFCFFYGELYFNPQGTIMASSVHGSLDTFPNKLRYDPNRVELYDFDRCDGSIHFRNYYPEPFDTSSYPYHDYKHGISFSPNGKLLYMSNLYTIYQIDIEDTNVHNATFIHGPDTTLTEFPWYETMACGPDGKLYIGNSNGTRQYMSYIDKPNIKGLGCDFVAQGVWQPYTNLMSPPNMPNYGLNADTSIVCWPLVASSISKEESKLNCYPNPASTSLTIELTTNKKGLVPLEMYNMVGELFLKTEIQSQTKVQISMSTLPKGVYVIRCDGASQKVVIE